MLYAPYHQSKGQVHQIRAEYKETRSALKNAQKIKIICSVDRKVDFKYDKRSEKVDVLVFQAKRASKRLMSSLNKNHINSDQSDYKPDNVDSQSSQLVNIGQIKQTKNIPKLYGKGFANFIKSMENRIDYMFEEQNIDKILFFIKVQQWNKNIISIQGIRQMWQEQHNPYAKIFRILSNLFLRKYMLHHIFNSKIYFHKRALKYRYKFIQGVKKPQNFTLIKEF